MLTVVIPGPGTVAALGGALPEWLREAHPHTRWTTSVCSGSIILGAAGLLEGLHATTHYRHLERLRMFGAIPTPKRVVEEPAARVITSAGVSSGVDMGLRRTPQGQPPHPAARGGLRHRRPRG